ncbi:MAG: hypothetical protein ACM3ON_09570 [Chloroflexota bacterium]
MLEIQINRDSISIGSRFAVAFHRTLRIPDDGRTYPLPPGLGVFPIMRMQDYERSVPAEWLRDDGAFIPMYQREALWIGFRGARWKPNAVKIGAGGINAISGESFDLELRDNPQDYIVCPLQPWLDGFKTGHDTVRQFVAMPLGLGYTVEASLIGEERIGGIQIAVFEPRPGRFPDEPPPRKEAGPVLFATPRPATQETMGLGAGGEMRQKVYPDPHGVATWDRGNYGTVIVRLVNSAEFRRITGEEPPPSPVDAKTYADYGLPWFALYDEGLGDVGPGERLKGARTVTERDAELQAGGESEGDLDIPESRIRKIRTTGAGGERAPKSG